MRQRLERHLLAQLVALGEHSISGPLCTAGHLASRLANTRVVNSDDERFVERVLFEQGRTYLGEQAFRVDAAARIHTVIGAHWKRGPSGSRV